MHRHVCTSLLLLLMMNFNLMKIIISLGFHELKNSKLPQFTSTSKGANFRVLQFYPLKMNLIPEIRRRRAKERGMLQLEIFFTSLSNTILILILCCMRTHHVATLADSYSILFQVRSCCFS